jgi:hypothetical protein
MNRVRALVELVLRYDPYGPERLVGEKPEPDWAELIDSIRDHQDAEKWDGGNTPIPEALANLLTNETVGLILSEIGGWDTIVDAGESISKSHPKMWSYLACRDRDLTLWQQAAVSNMKRLLFETIFAKGLDKIKRFGIIKIRS